LVIPVLFALCTVAMSAENAALKSGLENALSNKTLVSRIMLGGEATPRGLQATYPVNTLISPSSDVVTFRVESLLIRTDVQPSEMSRRFEQGTSFRVTNIDLKDDRLELKLQSGNGGSAKLKLMLGEGWQSKVDLSAIQAQLARVFVLDETQRQAEASTGTSSAPSPSSSGAGETRGYRHDSHAAKVEGRISDAELDAVMARFDQDTRRAYSSVSRDAEMLSRALIVFQRTYGSGGMSPQARAISQLQDRLGKDLHPRSEEDVLQMVAAFKQCIRIAQLQQARDERGNLYNVGGDSQAVEQLLLSDSAAKLSNRVENDLVEARQQKVPVEEARATVIRIEQTLDSGDLVTANEQYQSLSSNMQLGNVAALQRYLQDTAAFQLDLSSYAQASELVNHRDLSTAEQLDCLAKEVELLNVSDSRPLTRNLLQVAITRDSNLAKMKLDALPSVHIDEASYRAPEGSIDSNLSNLNERLSFVKSRIADLNEKLSSVGDLRQVAAETDALATANNVLGTAYVSALQKKTEQVAIAERALASLTEVQESIQNRIAKIHAEEERIAEEARVAAAAKRAAAIEAEERIEEEARAASAAKLAATISERERYAERLTKNMSGEIHWSATGGNKQILAGAVAVNRLSDSTYNQLGASSPLWKELFSRGFIFRAILDKDRTLKVAKITGRGGFGSSISELPDEDRSSLEQTVYALAAAEGKE